MNARNPWTTAQGKLDEAYEALERHAPDRFTRLLRSLRHPGKRKLRLAAGAALVALGVLGPVLPVAGVWMIPLGLLLMAEDLPALQEPMVKLSLWLERKWVGLRSWWQRRMRTARAAG